MRAWEVEAPEGPGLRLVERPMPTPAPGEVLLRVLTCGVCRTDLHVVHGELPEHRAHVVPGHEVVGEVVEVGTQVSAFAVGDRVGVAWLRHTCGQCRWCRAGTENLCPDSRYTGWDVDGGFAEAVVAPADFAYRIPDGADEERVAPMLCAGIIGYRALRRSALPTAGRLGIYGFGASAHITAQIAIAQGAEVHVLSRGEGARALALELGAASARGAHEAPPVPLDSAIIFAPAGDLVPGALAALDRGGTLALAGIHMSDVPSLNYQDHLFRERTVTSVTSNTRRDGAELLALAERLSVSVRTTAYAFEQADLALSDLADTRVTGAAVLRVHPGAGAGT